MDGRNWRSNSWQKSSTLIVNSDPIFRACEFYRRARWIAFAKLRQKSAQVSRIGQQADDVTPAQREAYARLLNEAQAQYDELQHELTVLNLVLQDLP